VQYTVSEAERIANQILTDVARVNPYPQSGEAYLYAAGFLAGYIAQLAEEDPFVYKKFRKHIADTVQNNRYKR
jgi:hypothetical protein